MVKGGLVQELRLNPLSLPLVDICRVSKENRPGGWGDLKA